MALRNDGERGMAVLRTPHQAADKAWDRGQFDASQLTGYLADLLKKQLADTD
ncbi:MAG: hypothetical protein ACYDC6_09735 [Acidobacteriaceae bacterium]